MKRTGRTLFLFTIVLGAVWGPSPWAEAQFNSGPRPGSGTAGAGGANGSPPAASPSGGTGADPAAGAGGAVSVRRSPGQGTIVYDAGNVKGASIGEMDVREAIVLGQAVVHPDGTYTQTRKVENDSNLLAQYTMSPNGVRLWKRIISCSASGRPEEVMIYDHHDELRFRGVLSYDRLGRFREEVIFDTHGNVLRQRIQEYGPAGPKLKVIDDLAKVPADMRLVITREDGAVNQEVARRNYQEFLEQAEERPAQAAAAGAEPEKPKRGLFKLFGGGKNKEKN